MFFFFKQKTAYEMRISDWSSDVCSSDLHLIRRRLLVQILHSQSPRMCCPLGVAGGPAITIPSEPGLLSAAVFQGIGIGRGGGDGASPGGDVNGMRKDFPYMMKSHVR